MKLDHDSFLMAGPGGPHDAGGAWRVEVIEEAYDEINAAADDIARSGMMSEELAIKFGELLAMLEEDVDGFRDANRS